MSRYPASSGLPLLLSLWVFSSVGISPRAADLFIEPGMPAAKVRGIQGVPDSIDRYAEKDMEVWNYGLSIVRLSVGDGKVIGWDNLDQNLLLAPGAMDMVALPHKPAGQTMNAADYQPDAPVVAPPEEPLQSIDDFFRERAAGSGAAEPGSAPAGSPPPLAPDLRPGETPDVERRERFDLPEFSSVLRHRMEDESAVIRIPGASQGVAPAPVNYGDLTAEGRAALDRLERDEAIVPDAGAVEAPMPSMSWERPPEEDETTPNGMNPTDVVRPSFDDSREAFSLPEDYGATGRVVTGPGGRPIVRQTRREEPDQVIGRDAYGAGGELRTRSIDTQDRRLTRYSSGSDGVLTVETTPSDDRLHTRYQRGTGEATDVVRGPVEGGELERVTGPGGVTRERLERVEESEVGLPATMWRRTVSPEGLEATGLIRDTGETRLERYEVPGAGGQTRRIEARTERTDDAVIHRVAGPGGRQATAVQREMDSGFIEQTTDADAGVSRRVTRADDDRVVRRYTGPDGEDYTETLYYRDEEGTETGIDVSPAAGPGETMGLFSMPSLP